ncbi:hypothetical protein [Actinoplanes sp. G11-F43]|uniref:hypothetical protein n=1 Tax=Actinoplanes sp. G11-F43 TaxID=3424130 RepID=UPI003D346BAB
MGTGGKSSHQAYNVAPTAGKEPGEDEVPATVPALAESAALAQIQALTGQPLGDLDAISDTYQQLVQLTDAAYLESANTPEQGDHPAYQDSHALTLAWLQQLTPEQLQHLAAAEGFDHPQLVGLSGKQPHPLVHVLDPYYDNGSASKIKIQAVANARYAALAAGETINGLTLADLPPPSPAAAEGQWTATVAEVSGLQAQLATTLADISIASKAYTDLDHAQKVNTGFAELIALENKLATATCPDDPQALAAAQAAAAHSITQALDNGLIQPHLAIQLRQDLVDAGTLTGAEASVLSTSQVIDIARPGTVAEQRAQLLELAGTRAGQLAKHQDLIEQHAALIGKKFTPYNEAHWAAMDPAALTTMATLTGELHGTEESIKAWSNKAFVPVQGKDYTTVWPESYTQGFRKWAKTQPLGQLRQAATELGLEHADKATRAQVQNYIAGQWDAAQDTTDIQTAVTAKATAPAPAASPAAAAAAPTVGDLIGAKSTTVTTSTTAAAKPVVTAKGSSWAAQHADLVAALKHHAASNSGLPQPMDTKVVSAWDFGKGTSAGHLGGTHSKSLHTGPDGKQWMFKRDSSGGARAAAEADASAVFRSAGLPAVPVYHRTVNGKSGSVQPLLTQASHFPGAPKSWSQADVDAIVRYHVGAWAVSNHDGHKDNLLRTPAGGMVAIDLGQAYKFCDKDKLSLSYNPVGATVTHDLYQAHLGGKLAKGVTVNPAVAHPVLAAIEKIPDAQWRTMLHDTAYTGAKADVPWVAGMRKRAAKSLGIPAEKVTTTQVAEAFLDAAVERKNGLRQAFSTFFTEELKLSSATALLSGR